ncbi:branched-chain-amino-acid transaminase [Pseudophaeobacter sp.]|uniref:branched-chain-amino-acid transaminase n=1 Tax=Pseudophaeobacter sp. TaxID=1971739 RepID=UPI003298D2F7
MPSNPDFSWLNGQIVPWDNCVLHARSQAAFWGANVFEGVRAYWSEETGQLSLFRLQEHLTRLRASMKCVGMRIAYSDAELIEATLELLRANQVREDTHIVIAAYFGTGPNFDPMQHIEETGVHITALPLGRSPRFETGASACISSWRRISDDAMPPRIKTGANYHNSRLAQHEATRNGYDTAFFLNHRGTLAEAPGSCVMMVRDGELCTPPGTSGVLEGITVQSISQLAQEVLGIGTHKREIDRTELYLADEVFIAGTLSEIQPITTVDRQAVGTGAPGPLTRQLQDLYEVAVRGTADAYGWNLPVYVPSQGRGVISKGEAIDAAVV